MALGLPRSSLVIRKFGPLGTPGAIKKVARRAEELGYDSLWVIERLLFPVKPKTPERPIKIRLSSLSVATECRIELIGIGRNPRDFRELAQQLASIQYNSRNPGGSFKADNPVIIEPDGFVRWQHVVNAFNAAIKARYTNVAFSQAREQ